MNFRPEIRIKSWVPLLNELMEGNERTRWEDREPHAYWKGNPRVAETRQDLLKCNVSDKQDWGARVYDQVHYYILYTTSYSNSIKQIYPVVTKTVIIESSGVSDYIFLISGSYWQDWGRESRQGFKTSNLANQCVHRSHLHKF